MGAVRAIPSGHTTWDKIKVIGPMTIGKLKVDLLNKHKVKISIMSVGKLCIYN
jgi:ubiquitin-activating enzyme E1